MKPRTILVALLLISPCSRALAADWPAFRGPTGNGVTQETNFPTHWSAGENIRWKVALPSPANGSPIVSAGRVFLTGADDDGRKRSLFCFDRTDGTQVWEQTVEFAKVMPTHQTNPYAGSTPAADGRRVVVWHSSAGLYCYDRDGNQLWSRDLGEFRHMWGYGSSPVLYRNRVILYTGPGKRIFVTALNPENGETIWETDEPQDGDGERRADGAYAGSWSTPVIASVGGRDQIVCSLPTRVNGYDPETGKILWSCDGLSGPRGDLAYSSALIADGFCVATGGFQGPSIGFHIRGSGNITPTERVWRVEKNPQNIGSGVFLNGYVYRPNAGPGTIECLEAKTGNVAWTDRAAGENCWGSTVAAGDTLYVTNQKGTTVVFKANRKEFDLVAVNKLDEPSNSTPAFSDSEIFLRTFGHLYCIAANLPD